MRKKQVGSASDLANYLEEVRPYLLSKQSWLDKSLELWLEMITPPKE